MGNRIIKPALTRLLETDDFRQFVRAWADAKPRGEYRKIAQALGMHTTLLSQALRGNKNFTLEQGALLAIYLQLSALETDYFLSLVQLDRAGNGALKAVFVRQKNRLLQQAKEAKSHVLPARELSASDRAVFYSSWQYGVVRLLTSISRYQVTDAIAERLSLPVSRISEILDFLVSRKLCVESSPGRFKRTDKNTHVEARSELAIRHHQNWRSKVQELQEHMTPDDLCLTSPISISKSDFPKVRSILLNAFSEIAKIVEPSSSEVIAYLGIDWLEIR